MNTLYKHRFELFFFSLVCVLFGSLFFPNVLFSSYISPLLFLINISSGLLFFLKSGKRPILILILVFIVFFIFLFNLLTRTEEDTLRYIKLVLYFVLYCLVTFKSWKLIFFNIVLYF